MLTFIIILLVSTFVENCSPCEEKNTLKYAYYFAHERVLTNFCQEICNDSPGSFLKKTLWDVPYVSTSISHERVLTNLFDQNMQ